jgi:GNAT superfamily N-acetyltransferase
MNTYIIRWARKDLAEASALLAVEHQSLGDSSYTPEEILAVMQRPEHHTYVACLAEELVGFCSCFETLARGMRRLEIDMLGVLPAHRRRGLASALVMRAVSEGRERGVCAFRGAVALGNTGSERAFLRAGLYPSAHPIDILVCGVSHPGRGITLPEGWTWHVATRAAESDGACPVAGCGAAARHPQTCWLESEGQAAALADYLPVYTMSYRGMWLEELWAKTEGAMELLARALVAHAQALGLDKVGYLAPRIAGDDSRAQVAELLAQQGYESVGRYRVFVADPGSDLPR